MFLHDPRVGIRNTGFYYFWLWRETRPNVVIIELKQWDKVEAEDALVEMFTGGAVREAVHPSYQACIHISQGLEFDYADITIGDDIRYERMLCVLRGQKLADYLKGCLR